MSSIINIGDVKVGNSYINTTTNQLSIVTKLTSNSIEVLNFADKKLVYSKKEGSGLKGIDSTNWYTIESFNRKYKSSDGK